MASSGLKQRGALKDYQKNYCKVKWSWWTRKTSKGNQTSIQSKELET